VVTALRVRFQTGTLTPSFSSKVMATFYFHIRAGTGRIDDPDGSELDDLAAAIAEASKDVRTLIAERLAAGEMIEAHAIEVTDADGLVLAVVRFHEVLFGLIKR
jgi:hypothetical protein